MAQKFHFAILRIEVTGASRGLSAIAELIVRKSKANMSTSMAQNSINAFNVTVLYGPDPREIIKWETPSHRLMHCFALC